MTDPEIEHARLVSGDAAAVRARAEDLMAAEVAAPRVPAGILGEVPRAATFAAAVEQVADAAGASLRTGAQAVGAVVTLLESSASDYSRTDDVVGSHFRGLTPPQ